MEYLRLPGFSFGAGCGKIWYASHTAHPAASKGGGKTRKAHGLFAGLEVIMAKCIIFCAAGFDGLLEPIQKDDFVIAADGGLRHTQALGLTPDCILGDFDSLGYVPVGAKVFPTRKDDTDSMLAIREGLSRGYRDFTLYGALDGERLDMTLANYQALMFLARQGARGVLVGKRFLAAVVQNGSLAFPAGLCGTVSVFCLGADARGVTIKGLSYPLEDAALTADFPLGVSNRFLGIPAQVSVKEGALLVIWER